MDLAKKRKEQSSRWNFKSHADLQGPDGFADFCLKIRRNRAVLVSKGRITDSFYTEDSKLYITPREARLIGRGSELDRKTGKWDSLSARIVRNYSRYSPEQGSALFEQFKKRYAYLQEDMADASRSVVGQLTVVRLWNLSIVGAILFGMFSMTMIYRYLGQGAEAEEVAAKAGAAGEVGIERSIGSFEMGDVRVVEDEGERYTRHFIEDMGDSKKEDLEKEIRAMVKGYPIEEMVPYIAKKDRIVAAFLIGIAKKESNWGKRVPVLNGQDCYNYWGYRGIRKLMGTGGHTCFNSRKDAVDTVAKRLQYLVENKELDTPEKMVIWKCGSDCSVTGGQAAANKWISDVNGYFKKLSY
ncbi:MAG: hypothetical protein UY41_C0017G0019 [Candidatus Moranbacteria bacterium GW2011_GWE1_49_15]|nr:MAG: hypothetical protein UX75_C0017G0018 [Candidatus Moranbacteria bacterium GW2011_GWE2_47_10]KKW06707.1 MAG: hypothetical protein UY41_C0017G0019 [Candidatus Moranbacteria bacterium GW2011_GWE1_49_15]HBP00757.1 hypothetical protein [Candidatus Moranbacteria bacterium]